MNSCVSCSTRRLLRGVAGNRPFELVELLPGEPPLGVIAAAAGLGVLVQREAADRCFGAGDAGIDGAGQQGDVIGMTFRLQAPGRARCWSLRPARPCRAAPASRAARPPPLPAAAPVEPLFFPRRHDVSLTARFLRAKPR